MIVIIISLQGSITPIASSILASGAFAVGMGFDIEDKYIPNSTFYLWLRLSCLPDAINDGLNFFQACLKEKVIVVPGIFFDLNPSKRRDLFDSPCHRKFTHYGC